MQSVDHEPRATIDFIPFKSQIIPSKNGWDRTHQGMKERSRTSRSWCQQFYKLLQESRHRFNWEPIINTRLFKDGMNNQSRKIGTVIFPGTPHPPPLIRQLRGPCASWRRVGLLGHHRAFCERNLGHQRDHPRRHLKAIYRASCPSSVLA